MVTLDGVERKLVRARHHLFELEQSVAAVYGPGLCHVVREHEPASRQVSYRVVEVPPADDRWPAMIGDCLSNLRSALDHLAWQLVLASGDEEPGRQTKYPIPREPKAGATAKAPIIRPQIDDEASDMLGYVEDLQASWPALPFPLRVLDNLCQVDKHRTLLVVTTALGSVRYALSSIPTNSVLSIRPIEPGLVVARFDFADEPSPDFDAQPTVSIRFGEPATTGPVLEVLRAILQFVETSVAGQFLDLLKRQGHLATAHE